MDVKVMNALLDIVKDAKTNKAKFKVDEIEIITPKGNKKIKIKK